MTLRVTFWITYFTTLSWFLGSYYISAHCVSTQAQQYIKKYRDLAIAEMYRTGIPASIKLAQGMFESQNGISTLATKANNHFGVKCKDNWHGDTILYDDDAPKECFRKYSSVEESFIDHSNILQQRDRYADLFMLSPTDYQAWAKGLKEAGYATLPNYAEKLIGIIEQYQLYEYDLGGMPEPAIAEQLKEGEAANFVAHAPKGTKPKRNTHAPQSDLASLDRAFNQSMAKRPNVPMQKLGGAPAVMPNASELKQAKLHKPKHEPNNTPNQPNNWQKVSDVISALPEPATQIYTAQKSNAPLPEPPLPTPAPEPTPDYLMPQYKHQSIMLLKSDKAATASTNEQGSPINAQPSEIVAVAERAAAPIKKLSPSELAAERRKDSKFLPPQKFNYVNEAKTVTYPYEVSVAQIAQTYKLSPEQVVKYNDLKGEQVMIPAQHNIFLQAKADKSNTKTHLVETNETLWSIAQKYGITLSALCDKNKITPNVKPLVGEKLYLKGDAPQAPKFDK